MITSTECVKLVQEFYPECDKETATLFLEQNTGYPYFLSYHDWGKYLRCIIEVKKELGITPYTNGILSKLG